MERHLPEKTFDRDAWVSAHLEKFVSGKTEPLPKTGRSCLSSKRVDAEDPRVDRGSDIGHMCAALDWAEDLSDARDAGERQRWLNYHRQILLCTLTRIEELIRSQAPPEPSYDVQQYWPYDDERRMLERVARSLPVWLRVKTIRHCGSPSLLWVVQVDDGSTLLSAIG